MKPLEIEAETAKLMAETASLKEESAWYPAMMVASTIVVTATIVKVFF